MNDTERGQAKIKTRIVPKPGKKQMQVADIRKDDWKYLFKHDPTSPTGLVYLPRYPAIFRASPRPEEHAETWNAHYAGKPVQMSPVRVLGRAYAVDVIHAGLGTTPPSRVPSKRNPPAQPRPRAVAIDPAYLPRLFENRGGQIVWKARDPEISRYLGFGFDPEWNAANAGRPVVPTSRGYVEVEYYGAARTRSFLRKDRQALLFGLRMLQQVEAGGDPNLGEPDDVRKRNERMMAAAQSNRSEAEAAVAAVEAANEVRTRTAYVKVSDIEMAVGGAVGAVAPRGYEARGMTKERRIGMLRESFGLLFRWDYRRNWSGGVVGLTMESGRVYGVIVPVFVEMDEASMLRLLERGWFDAPMSEGRITQWNTRHAGEAFVEGSMRLGNVRFTAEEVTDHGPEAGKPPGLLDPAKWEKVGETAEGDAVMKPRSFGF